MTLGSDTGPLRHPQRRTKDFTNPSAMAEVHFLQWPDRSILSQIFEIFLRRRRSDGSRVGCEIASPAAMADGKIIVSPTTMEVNSVNPSAMADEGIHPPFRNNRSPLLQSFRNDGIPLPPVVRLLTLRPFF